MNDTGTTEPNMPPARRGRRWKIVAIVALVLPSVVVWLLCARSDWTIQITPELAVTTTLPSEIAKWRTTFTTGTAWLLKVSSNNIPIGQLILRGDVWDGPVMLLPGEKAHELVCVYCHDTHMEVIAFDLNRPAAGPLLRGLNLIIASSPWQAARLMAKPEFTALAQRLEQMDEREFKQLSLPALNFGPFYLNMSREEVIQHLEKRADPNYILN